MLFSESRFLSVVLSSLLLATVGEGYAQTPHPLADRIVTIENVPSPTSGKVNAIFRDGRGFLWFATTNGLHRYDGYEVRVYQLASGKHDEQRLITAILRNGDRSLLLATLNGLWTFDVVAERFAPYAPDVRFGNGRVQDLAEDEHHTLWIGTLGTGLFSHTPATGETRSYTREQGLSHDRVTHLLADDSGKVWIGTSDGLDCLDPPTGRIVQYHSDPGGANSLSSNDIRTMAEDDSGGIWVGTLNGITRIDRRSGRIQRLLVSPGMENEVRAIARDSTGRVWIGVWGVGLFVYSDGVLTPCTPSGADGEGFSDRHITTLFVDPTSTRKDLLLWIATRGGGVDRLRIAENPFTTFTRQRNLPIRGNGALLSLYRDREGILWVGLWGGGLNALRYRSGRYALVHHFLNDPGDPLSLPDNTVNSIMEDRQGTLWVGTSNGLAALERGRRRFAVYAHRAGDSTSLAGGAVSKVFEDRAGGLWVCTNGGLSRLLSSGPGRFRNYFHTGRDAHTHVRVAGGNFVSDILEDRSGRLWVSMYGGGLNTLGRDGTQTRYLFAGDSDRTHESWIYNLHEDRKGIFWLETAAGPVTFDPSTETFARFLAEELHSAHVYGFVDDADGMLWLSTDIGLIRIDPRTRTFKRFDRSHGLPFNELYSPFFRTGDGRLIVGGLDGFAEFFPGRVVPGTSAPAIVITSFSIFGRPAQWTGPEIELAHSQNFFSFSFAALDYRDPRRNHYAYRMAGVDSDWVNAGTRNYASYTNIDPGEYTFEVKGASSEGVWNETGATIRVLIAPPYWRTWWFRLLVAGIMVGGLYSAYRYRLGKLLEMERLRVRIAGDLHDDLGSNLSAIAMAIMAIQRSPELSRNTRQKLAKIYETAVETSEGVRDLVWFITPEDNTLDGLFVRMKETASSLLGDIAGEFRTSKPGNPVRITGEFKRNIFLAFKEVLTNIVKHSGATRVEISLVVRDGGLEVLVRDNGKGFDPALHGRGNGLPSLRKRARNLGGTCEILSRPGDGTAVRISAALR